VANKLDLNVLEIPVEGYYTETPELTEYFLTMRTLQGVHNNERRKVANLTQYPRLLEITSAPLYGCAKFGNHILPTGRDPLSQALIDHNLGWSVNKLTESAYLAAKKYDDYSLVGLCARVKDPVLLAATRESTVLYAEFVELISCAPIGTPPIEYTWSVNEDLAHQAQRFINTFIELFQDHLPQASAESAQDYWMAHLENEIGGRCVAIGSVHNLKKRIYHWAIDIDFHGKYIVRDFWDQEKWTTERYRNEMYMRFNHSSTSVNEDTDDGDFSSSIDPKFERMSLADIMDDLVKKT
jgi:hypothetical protein